MLPDDLITGLLSINADHWRSMPINAHQCWINSAWSGIDQHWSALIGIDRHWHQCRDFDRHWALIEGILCHSCKVSQFVLALTKSGRLFDMAKSKVWQMNEKLMLRTHICKHTRITSPKPPSAMVSSRIILLSESLGILIRYDSRVIRSSSSDISSSSEEESLLLLTANLKQSWPIPLEWMVFPQCKYFQWPSGKTATPYVSIPDEASADPVSTVVNKVLGKFRPFFLNWPRKSKLSCHETSSHSHLYYNLHVNLSPTEFLNTKSSKGAWWVIGGKWNANWEYSWESRLIAFRFHTLISCIASVS